MTYKTISVLFVMTVLMTSATAISVDLIPNAEALKSIGNPILKTGSANSLVCGDRLCSEVGMEPTVTVSQKQPNLSPTNLPLDIPLTMGYANGEEIFYISTEASVAEVASDLTDLTGFRVVYAPALEFTPKESLAQIYAFTNGVDGSGVFGFQPQVVDSQPGDDNYSPLWNVNAVTWNEDSEPRELKSEMDIFKAQSNGELSVEEADVIVNCPVIKWDGGQLQLRDNSYVTDDDPYGGGQVLDIDLENMKVTFVAHKGFAPNGDTIFYIATDASTKETADALGVVHAPRIQETLATASSSDLYVFTNGLEGNGPLGFQASIGSTTAGDKFYSPLWRIQTVTWDNPDSASFLKTADSLTRAATNGKLETGLAGFVVNCPFVEVDSEMMDSMMKDDHMMKDKMMKDKMMKDKMMKDKMMMDDNMMDDNMMDDNMMDDNMMDDNMMDDNMMDDNMMDDNMMDDNMMDYDHKMKDDHMMKDKMMKDKMMKDNHKMRDDHMMKDKMMKDDYMMKTSMMMEDGPMKGDLTAPSGDDSFDGKIVGTFSIFVDDSDHVMIRTYIENTSSGMIQEGWLVDMDSGYKLSLGIAHDNGKLYFSQQMVNPWIYDAIVITEEPIGDSNPKPNTPVGGVLLETPFGL